MSVEKAVDTDTIAIEFIGGRYDTEYSLSRITTRRWRRVPSVGDHIRLDLGDGHALAGGVVRREWSEGLVQLYLDGSR